jgi:hypothetical protein
MLVSQNLVTPSRFFGLKPSRRAIFTCSGEGSEASVAALAGFDPVAALAAGVDGSVAEGEAADAGALEVGALEVGADGLGAGAWAPQGVAAATRSNARKTAR